MTSSLRQQSLLPLETSLEDLAAEFLLAMLASADTDVIQPKQWWERGRTALETAAAQASTFGQMVSACGKKLQLETLTAASADRVAAVQSELGTDERFAEWQRICERDALYIAAVARIRRQQEKAR